MDNSTKKHIAALLNIHHSDRGIAHIYSSLCLPKLKEEISFKPVVPSLDISQSPSYLIGAIPRFLQWPCYRLNLQNRIAELRLLKELTHAEAAYIWPGASLEVINSIRETSKPLFLERVNCFTGKAKQILDEAYSRLSFSPQHLITPELIEHEIQEVKLADFVFCPSPEVKASFLEAGFPEQKLILTSYGWSKHRLKIASTELNFPKYQEKEEGFTLLFMGYVCVRKGAHLLMDYFVKSGIEGRLILCGNIEDAILESCGEYLNHPNIEYNSFTDNVSELYRSASVFVFPSLEEGDPLVTHEAMIHGLPVLVSPMGSGSAVRDGIDGWVISPYEEEAWIEKIRELAQFPNVLEEVGQSAQKRAQEFEFEEVANQRAKLMLNYL